MEIGTVQNVDINDEMRSAYLDYAMSVIVSRALPDARDGLKPVHRRILYAMQDMGIRAGTPYKKSARIVGEVLGKYHPHSDTAVYESMARMAQEFSLRYPLVDGQGNFGSIGGDPPAAMRYTEARMGRLAGEMLVDIQKDTVDFAENFDASLEEPTVLPSRIPNLLLNGSSGIAVGMASNIPPHNLNELTSAISYMIDNFSDLDNITVEDLLEHVTGPDFPTGGIIVGTEGLRQVYSSGRGKIIVRGRAEIEEVKGRFRIVISEIPYQLNLTTLIERIADLVRNGRLDGISDLRDESDRNGMSIILELKRGAQPNTVLNRLYKYTPLQSTFAAQVLALVDNEPRLLSLKRALQLFIEHRQVVITRRSQFDLDKAKARAHILEGLLLALADIDEVIKTIRESSDVDQAKERLISRFKLSAIQAQAILDMQLRRLAALERQKIEDEHKEVLAEIDYLEDLLANPEKILALIKDDMAELVETYGDERRTSIDPMGSSDLNEEDLVKDEAVLISITERGYVKRVSAKTFRAQGRGGRGVKGHETKDEDEVLLMLPARTLDTVLFFSDRGKVYSQKAYRLPDAGRTASGTPIVNILALGPTETITAAVTVPDFKAADFCTMATRTGRIKRVSLAEFESVRPSGLIAINLAEDDELGWVRLTNGENEIVFVTEKGQALRYSEQQVRSMGRTAAGVIGIRIKGDDRVASMEVVEPGGDLLVVSTRGIGKRSPLEEYTPKGRGTMGVKTTDHKALDTIGRIASARVVQEADDLTIISSHGVVIRTKVKDIKRAGRATRGVHIMNLDEGDTVATLARMAAADLKQVGASTQDNGASE
ncbi:MAG: DNA gyrase subunit A [Chloroflexi bacterium]|nr:MAG: DNA gyrase subunit A [Chloroflexota bacterium]MBL1196873.1 DNA gyrase subunit A [Chloroflexota bacterium]NOH14169.1 DNA gyrase subunit A [Chloroflexota bacterium]